MKVSSRVDYALSCILRVADEKHRNKPVTVAKIAEKEGLEPDYVERLCVMMRRFGILKSIRGKAGGYILGRRPDRISAKDVTEAIERSVLELVCFRKKARRRQCIHLEDCNIRYLWENLKKDMESSLERFTLDNLVRLRRREKNW